MENAKRSIVSLLLTLVLFVTLVASAVFSINARANNYNDPYWSGSGISITSQGLSVDEVGNWYVDLCVDNTSGKDIVLEGDTLVIDDNRYDLTNVANKWRFQHLEYDSSKYRIYVGSYGSVNDVRISIKVYDKDDGLYIANPTPLKSLPLHKINVTGVKFNKEEYLIKPKEELDTIDMVSVLPKDATYKDYIVTSSEESVVEVQDNSKKVKALKEGNAILTVRTIDGDYSDKCEVVVKEYQPVTSVTLEPLGIVSSGESIDLAQKTKVYPDDATDKSVRYESSNPYVARINNDKTLTAVSVGTVRITAMACDGSGKLATSDLTVRNNHPNPGDLRNWPVSYEGNTFIEDSNGIVRCYDSDGNSVINAFKCDGVYTYYFQLDGTAMQDRLTYHPDGVHIIYFDEWGHEVFSDFANVKKTIAGDVVNDFCFFDVFGYMYINVLTYDKAGKELYYANAYGVLERGQWFQFDPRVKWADGKPAIGVGGGYGYAQADSTLYTNAYTYDWLGRFCYLQANGVARY